jgi:hypothetical protein
MKTIFITSFHPLISRNIFSTGLLEMLSRNFRIVLFVPDMKKEYFEKEFSAENILIEGTHSKLTKKELIFRQLFLALSYTETLSIKKRSEFHQNRKIFTYIFSALPAFIFGRMHFAVRILRAIDVAFGSTGKFVHVFEKYTPALVFSTDIQNENDVELLYAAKKRGIPTIGMVRSWDNLTAKGLIRAIPDRFVVNNEVIQKEAMRYNFIPEKDISIVGIPHYDRYIAAPPKSREEFLKECGLDPAKKTIVYAPIGNRYLRFRQTDKEALEVLSEYDVNILVRIPPTDTVTLDGFKSKKATIFFDEPGTRTWKAGVAGAGKKMNEIAREDEEMLLHSLAYADLVVTGLSTICIDAAVFSKPVISICIDKPEWSYWDSFRRYHGYDHVRSLIESGGVKIAYSWEELREAVTLYFRDPLCDREGRMRLLKEQAFMLDGKSTERLATILNKALMQ